MRGWTELCALLLALSVFSYVDAGVPHRRFRRGRLGLPPPRRSRTNSIVVETLNFTQLQDHFEPTNQNTWNQKYYASSSYFKTGGPVFIFISGEAPADIGWSEEGAWTVYAKKYKALMFQLEHRFYGDSHPTSDVSVDSLRYLTSEQALADVATFIVGMNEKYNLSSDTKWIAFGGSYAGNLAAWARYKYPHLIHAAVSSSGPLYATVDFYEYFDVVEASLGTSSSSCPTNVIAANKQVVAKLNTTKGLKQLDSIFNFCTTLDPSNTFDVYTFLSSLADPFAVTVQYDNEDGYEISSVCDIMTDSSQGSLIQRLAAVYQSLYGSDCLDISYDDTIAYYNTTSWDDNSDGGRQWTYQTCTEFGYYQTCENSTELFGSDFPLQYYLQQCYDIFGKDFTESEIYEGVSRTNTIYGGKDIQATRVVYVHGTIDPWHVLGVYKTTLSSSPAILINGTAHCANMMPPESTDPADLKAARKKIQKLIGKWLKEK